MFKETSLSIDLSLDERVEIAAPAYAYREMGENGSKSVHDRQNLSPLLRASCWGFEDLVQSLIADGADVTEADQKGETYLHKAARFAHTSVAIALLKNGSAVDAIDHMGMTALHWSALNGNTQMTRLLLLHQADTKIQDHYAGGMTPAEMAELMGHHKVLAIMEKYRWVRE